MPCLACRFCGICKGRKDMSIEKELYNNVDKLIETIEQGRIEPEASEFTKHLNNEADILIVKTNGRDYKKQTEVGVSWEFLNHIGYMSKQACDIIDRLEARITELEIDRDAHSKVRQRHLVRCGKMEQEIDRLESENANLNKLIASQAEEIERLRAVTELCCNNKWKNKEKQ